MYIYIDYGAEKNWAAVTLSFLEGNRDVSRVSGLQCRVSCCKSGKYAERDRERDQKKQRQRERERGKEREKERESERESQRESERARVCVRKKEREREREREGIVLEKERKIE